MPAHFAHRGFALIAVVLLIVVGAVVAATVAYVFTSGTQSSADLLQSKQALFVTESGMERALRGYTKEGAACAALTYSGTLTVGAENATFATTGTAYNPGPPVTLTQDIGVSDTILPVSADPLAAGYASHGRLTLSTESINYTGTSTTSCGAYAAPCFTGVSRAVDGTTAVDPVLGDALLQNQCVIRSVGTVDTARRTMERAVSASAGGSSTSDFLDGASTAIGTGVTNIGSLATTRFATGTNLVMAAISLEKPGGNTRIRGNRLRLRRGGSNLALNQYDVRLGGNGAPSQTSFARETMFLLARETGVPANPSYYVDARADAAGMVGEVKMVAINNPPASDYFDGNSVNIGTGAAGTNILNRTFTLPAGDNIIIAAVQVENRHNTQARTIAAGDLRLRRGSTVLATNQYDIDLMRRDQGNSSTGFLLVARDPGVGANATYNVNARASGSQVRGEAKMIVLNGLPSAISLGTTNVGTTETVIGSLATTFAGGESVVLAPTQYDNGANATRIVPVAGERLVFGGAPQSSSAYSLSLCRSAWSVCDDFAGGLLWRQAAVGTSPVYDVRALADNAGIAAETKILAIHLPAGLAFYDWQEIF